MSSNHSMDGWLPVNIIPNGQEPLCKWMFTANTKFTDPFFTDTLLRCKQFEENKHPFNSVSSLGLMTEWIKMKTSIPPAAFIFHVSRCGSTTLSQLLTLDLTNRVLSEVPFLDEILRLPFKYADSTDQLKVDEYFRAGLAWYSQPSEQHEQRLFIKTDSWHLHFYPLLRKMFPNAACIIITRAPAEVLQSQRRQRGIQSIPGYLEPGLFGFDEKVTSFDLDRHMERVLESYYSRILDICRQDPYVTLVDYEDGIENMLQLTYQLTNATMPAGLEAAVKERLQFDGKNPWFYFNPKTNDPSINVSSRCMDLYRECQSFRTTKLANDKTSQHQ